MSHKLETHWFISRVYSSAMAWNLLRLFFKHYDARPAMFDKDEVYGRFVPSLKRLKGMSFGVRLKAVDEVMVSRCGGPRGEGLWPFENGAEGYYTWASPNKMIEKVKR